MKNLNILRTLLPKFAILCVIIFSFSQITNAQVVTFAQYFQRNGTQDYEFTNNGTDGSLKTVTSGSPIFFLYQNVNNLPPELLGIQNAHLFVTTTTTMPSSMNGGQLTQPLNDMTTIEIVRDTPTSPGVGRNTRTILLRITFSSNSSTPSISGNDGGNSASLSAATPGNNVEFSSEFVAFNLTTQRAAALSFSSVIADYSSGAGGFLENFTAAGTGTFSSNPPPTYFEPTAANVSVSGSVTGFYGRGIPNAIVKMSDSQGNDTFVRTNSFGKFTFDDVELGETYVFQVHAKGYSFAPQVMNVNDNVSGLNFSQGFFW